MVKPTDVKKVTLTRSEWNLLDAAISPEKRKGQTLHDILQKLMKQVGD